MVPPGVTNENYVQGLWTGDCGRHGARPSLGGWASLGQGAHIEDRQEHGGHDRTNDHAEENHEERFH